MGKLTARTGMYARTTLALAFFMAGLCAWSDQVGPSSPTEVVNGGTNANSWTDPQSAAVSNDQSASVEIVQHMDPAGVLSDELRATEFGFDIPDASVIDGVEVAIERRSLSGSAPAVATAQLTPGGDAKSDTLGWGTIDSASLLGGAQDMWGLELSPGTINDPGFGVVYQVGTAENDPSNTFLVDSIMITVHFTPPDLFDACAQFPTIEDQHAMFRSAFGLSNDIDEDGLPDTASLALVEAVLCLDEGSELNDATVIAYNINLSEFDAEPGAQDLQEFRLLIPALMLVSDAMQDAVENRMFQEGIELVGDYQVVTCADGACLPDVLKDVPLSKAFVRLNGQAKAANEPYSALGDLDADGTTNLQEFTNVIDQGGRTNDFVVAATSDNLDGTEPIRNGGGSGGTCVVATIAYGTPLAREISVLRGFRDETLLPGVAGAVFVDSYYRIGPLVVDSLSEQPVVLAVLRPILSAVVEGIVFSHERPWAFPGAGVALVCTFGLTLRRKRGRRAR